MRIRTATTAALALSTAFTLAGCAGNTAGSGSMPGMDHGSSSSASPSVVTADHNDADVMFAQMMIPHHQQAIEMADMILAKNGIDPGVITLAQQIKAAQQPEIEQLQGWLQEWGADTAGSMGGMDHGGGMMSDQDMQTLDAATGADASRLFLEQMTMHHEGAITMAQDEVDNGQNGEALQLAQIIMDAQTAEIATMQDLLGQA